MATEKQQAANRLNAEKSTGPKTEHGKQNSSRNATRHGIFSRAVPITGPKGWEDPDDYRALLDGLADAFGPEGPVESLLVQDMADARWRLERVARAEGGMISRALSEVEAAIAEARTESVHRDLQELEKEASFFEQPARKKETWVSAERSARLNRETIQRRLRRTSTGLAHLIETLDSAIIEVGRGLLTNSTCNRLRREFSYNGLTLLEFIYQTAPLETGQWVDKGPKAGNITDLSLQQQQTILKILTAQKENLDVLLAEAEQREFQMMDAARAEAAVPNERGVALIARYQTMCERQFFRALDRLDYLQRQRREAGSASKHPHR